MQITADNKVHLKTILAPILNMNPQIPMMKVQIRKKLKMDKFARIHKIMRRSHDDWLDRIREQLQIAMMQSRYTLQKMIANCAKIEFDYFSLATAS